MKILLCESYLGPNSGEPLAFPLGLAYLASMIKGKHEVYGWDPNVVENPMQEFPQILKKINPDIVGLSLRNIDSLFSYNTRSYYPPFVSMVRIIKETLPSCKLVVGGSGFSLFSEEIMKRNPEIDIGIISEGELAFYELLENLDHPERVKNLVVRRNGKLFFTGREGWLNFDLLLPPSREFFDLEKYRKEKYSMGIQSKRGCSFSCSYCPNRFIVGGRFRLRSPKKVVDEIEQLVNEYGINSFFFVDSVFNFPLDHARAICREIIKRKLDVIWQTEFRPEFLNASFMKEAIKAGCTLFSVSPDGASNGALQFLGKNFTVDIIDKTIDLVKKIEGARIGYSFFYDLPSNNRDHTYGLLRLFLKIQSQCRHKVSFISLTKIRILPYTHIYRIARKQGKIRNNGDLIYPVHYHSSLPVSFTNLIPNLIRGAFIIDQKAHNLFKS